MASRRKRTKKNKKNIGGGEECEKKWWWEGTAPNTCNRNVVEMKLLDKSTRLVYIPFINQQQGRSCDGIIWDENRQDNGRVSYCSKCTWIKVTKY